MRIAGKRLALVGLLAAAGMSLSACVYDDYGYGGVSVGYGGGGYYDDYYPGVGYGWYDGFYYPGTGYYVYDRGGTRHRWNDRQRRYWEERRHHGDGQVRPGRPGRPDGRPDRPGRPDRGDWQDRRDAARGKGLWGAVPPRSRPDATVPRAAPSQRSVVPRSAPAQRAAPQRGRPSPSVRSSPRGRDVRNHVRPD